MNQKKRILFFGEAVTLAHVARPMVLARSLDATRFAVEFACHPRFSPLFPESRFPLRRIETIPSEQFEAALAAGRPLYDVATLRRYVEEDLLIIEAFRPDAVVGDFRLSLAVSAAAARVPYFNLTNVYWSPYARQRFPVPELALSRMLGVRLGQILFNLARPIAFAHHAQALNTVRREHGLPSLGHDLRQTYTYADHTLYADIPQLIPTSKLPANHHFLGAVLWSPDVPIPDWWEDLDDERPLVYVTLGSSGRSELLPVVLEALSGLPVTVMAATAGRVSLARVPANARVADYLPGEAAAARARLVICNGGSPTTQQALTAGIPVLGIPGNLDQHLNMQAVAAAGAGQVLRAGHASVSAVAAAAASLLNEQRFTRAATGLAATFQQYHAAARFQHLLKAAL
jgi:UDP:flavonoid glycosyltransferase YjiC (YdhE family)